MPSDLRRGATARGGATGSDPGRMAAPLAAAAGQTMKAILALLLAVAPGSYAWWAGRRLVRLKSDPTLPERFLGRRSRVLQAAAVAAAVVLALLRPHAIWALPLLAAGMLTGSFPARRAILEETWTFGAYAGHVLRLSTASVGFWILLALAPTLIPDLGPAR